jgi:hypothetical protein
MVHENFSWSPNAKIRKTVELSETFFQNIANFFSFCTLSLIQTKTIFSTSVSLPKRQILALFGSHSCMGSFFRHVQYLFCSFGTYLGHYQTSILWADFKCVCCGFYRRYLLASRLWKFCALLRVWSFLDFNRDLVCDCDIFGNCEFVFVDLDRI